MVSSGSQYHILKVLRLEKCKSFPSKIHLLMSNKLQEVRYICLSIIGYGHVNTAF